MNIQRGLERVSAAWWGFWGLLCLVLSALSLSKGQLEEGLGLAAFGAAVYALHRVTCWIIAGFFTPRGTQERSPGD